jgi:hypothetical protein
MSSTQNKMLLERPSKHIARLLTLHSFPHFLYNSSRETFILGNCHTHKLLVVLYASKEAHLKKNTLS